MIWGKYFWKTFHLVAIGYPENPTDEQKQAYLIFYKNFGNILPCKNCSLNYNYHLNELPIESYLNSRHDLFSWTVYFHNIVNAKLGKPKMDVSLAWQYYKSGEYDKNNNENNKNIFSLEYIINGTVIVLTIIIMLFCLQHFVVRKI